MGFGKGFLGEVVAGFSCGFYENEGMRNGEGLEMGLEGFLDWDLF